MMNCTCESEIRVQNEDAVRFSVISKPAPILEYIKTISSLVGASHILAVFDEIDTIKVYFDDKRYVDSLIGSGIHVMGHHVRVDYVTPPGDKVILSNVDPIIANCDIMRILSPYGNIVSPVIRPSISDDIELCHIGYGVRYVYMIMNGCHLPDRIDFKCRDRVYRIKIRVEDYPEPLPQISVPPQIKTDDVDANQDEVESNTTAESYDSLPGPSGIDISAMQETSDPVLVSVQSAVIETNSEVAIESSNPQTSSVKFLSNEPLVERYRENLVKKRRGRPPRPLHLKRKITAISQAAKKIKRNVKHNWLKTKKVNNLKKGKRGRKRLMIPSTTNLLPTQIYSSSSSNSDCVESDIKVSVDSTVNCTASCVLDKQQLTLYLDEVKGHRAPLELAKKYIGNDCDSSTIESFIKQLYEYNLLHSDVNLKSRILRLIKSINDSL